MFVIILVQAVSKHERVLKRLGIKGAGLSGIMLNKEIG
jgi:hypothetical protein